MASNWEIKKLKEAREFCADSPMAGELVEKRSQGIVMALLLDYERWKASRRAQEIPEEMEWLLELSRAVADDRKEDALAAIAAAGKLRYREAEELKKEMIPNG